MLFGALTILYFLSPWHKSVLLLFISGMLVASLLEYFGGYMMEKIFKIKLWDYSDYKYNNKGRVCLKNSIMFGVLAVLLVLYINPAVVEFIDSIDFKVLSYLVSIAMIIAIIDTSFSVFALIDIKKILHETIEASHIKRVKGSYKRSKARLHKAYPKMRVAVSDRINKKNKY
ncbi:MAG: putative ABC transporter permease [Erysipelothrix sp.]|nr:putative ABC transporter permease [Erysipelothrix sp.]